MQPLRLGNRGTKSTSHWAGADPSPTGCNGWDLWRPQGARTWAFRKAPKDTSCEMPVGLSSPSTGTRSLLPLGPVAGLRKTCSPLLPACLPAGKVVLQAQKCHRGCTSYPCPTAFCSGGVILGIHRRENQLRDVPLLAKPPGRVCLAPAAIATSPAA